MGNFFPYYPQRGIVMTMNGNYHAKVHLPEAQFDTDWADSCVWLPSEGVEVLVVFVNGDLNRPVITNRLPTDDEAGNASIELGGGGSAVARVGDEVQVDMTTGKGTITSGSSKVMIG